MPQARWSQQQEQRGTEKNAGEWSCSSVMFSLMKNPMGPGLKVVAVATPARGHGRLDRVGVGCAWGIKLEPGETHRSP